MEAPTTATGLSRSSRIFHGITRWSLYLLFFLTPIVFLPWTTELFEINKQTLLVLLTALAIVTWVGSMVVGKRLIFRSGWLNLFPVLVLVGVFLSSLFSLAGYQTWVGQASQEYTSFLSFAMFILLFYVLMHTAGGKQIQTKLLSALIASATLTGIVTVLGMLNIWHLPFDFAQSTGFNTIGTINGFAAFMLVIAFIGLSMWLVSGGEKGEVIPTGKVGVVLRLLIVVQVLMTVFALVAIDFWVFWVLSIAGVVLLAIFHFIQEKKFPNPKRFALPILVLLVSILLLFLRTPVQINLPVVVTPSYTSSWNIAANVLTANPTGLLFGSGPGTFAYDYARFKPVEVNQTVFWNVVFDRSKSHAITMLATLGLIGTLLILVFGAVLLLRGLGRLLSERDHDEWKMTYILFVSWSLVVLMHILYSSNFTMHFLFWALSGLLASQVAGKLWLKSFAQAPKIALAFSAVFVVMAVGVLAGVFISEQRYEAELAFMRAVELDRSGAPIGDVIGELLVATQKNSLSDVYYRNLSNALLIQAGQIISSAENGQLTEEQTQRVSQLVATSVNAARTATDIEPANRVNWVARGAIYRDVMPFVGNAEDFAAATFTTAAQLEPANPVHYTNLGRIHLTVANRAASLLAVEDEEVVAAAQQAYVQNLQTAEQAFLTAIALKGDYAPAHYYLAVVYEREGRLAESAARLAVLVQNNPADVGLAFELGILALRLQDLEVAKAALERVLSLAPDYSNAMWFLASVHELQGDRQSAIQLVERVSQLNPENEVVTRRLERMKAGELTTIVPQPLQEGVDVAPPQGGLPEVGGESPEGDAPAADPGAQPAAPAEEPATTF